MRDPFGVAAGLALAVVGGLLLADQLELLDLTFGWLAPLACAVGGVLLLSSGLMRR